MDIDHLDILFEEDDKDIDWDYPLAFEILDD